jgi:hypothetical protein
MGTVALSEPQCNVLVVLSQGAFSVLSEQSYIAVWEGDAIQGAFDKLGVQRFVIIRVMPVYS